MDECPVMPWSEWLAHRVRSRTSFQCFRSPGEGQEGMKSWGPSDVEIALESDAHVGLLL